MNAEMDFYFTIKIAKNPLKSINFVKLSLDTNA